MNTLTQTTIYASDGKTLYAGVAPKQMSNTFVMLADQCSKSPNNSSFSIT